ncbi:hypothetical protein [Antrihabitans spumae]|jgi:hypothetical protein|uniref:EfeO-type cupredoxin-like domain-containing protein n=1 Tax=Antrihabitans spumae TaxID=3373370 RepID=A0ABW7K587_9NOCA
MRTVVRRKSFILAACAVASCALVGCGSDDSVDEHPAGHTGDHTTSAAAAPSVSAQEPAQLVFAVADGRKTSGPDTVEVQRGAVVVLEVTSDQADELHLHGYDQTAELQPGVPGKLEFKADIPGTFELELHSTDAVLTQVRVAG